MFCRLPLTFNMGVKDLWLILDPVQKYTPLDSLDGTTVAVDMSAWLVENQVQGKKSKNSKMHIRYLL